MNEVLKKEADNFAEYTIIILYLAGDKIHELTIKPLLHDYELEKISSNLDTLGVIIEKTGSCFLNFSYFEKSINMEDEKIYAVPKKIILNNVVGFIAALPTYATVTVEEQFQDQQNTKK